MHKLYNLEEEILNLSKRQSINKLEKSDIRFCMHNRKVLCLKSMVVCRKIFMSQGSL